MEIYILFSIIVIIVVVVTIVIPSRKKADKSGGKAEFEYAYTRKQFIMTKAENEFYGVLQQVVGTNYLIIPQAHLDLFLNHHVNGQNWKGALSKIQRKSVDFLICSRGYCSPLVAIELDGTSHTEDERMARDDFVDSICKNAGMPIVHILSNGHYDSNELVQTLAPYLK